MAEEDPYAPAKREGAYDAHVMASLMGLKPSKEKKSAPRSGRRALEDVMGDDAFADWLRTELGADYNAAMAVPFYQWGGQWKGSSKKMASRVRAAQSMYKNIMMMKQGVAAGGAVDETGALTFDEGMEVEEFARPNEAEEWDLAHPEEAAMFRGKAKGPGVGTLW
jgi:hypothetical protein